MAYLWSKKAEEDYAARHPKIGKRNPRKAGTEAMYDGKPLKSGNILTAFKMRGWIDTVKKKADFNGDKEALRKWKRNEYMKKKNQENRIIRWKELVAISENGCTIEEAAEKLGCSVQSIKSFISYGSKDLGEEYGEVQFLPSQKPQAKPKKTNKVQDAEDKKLWKELHSLCENGYSISNAAAIIGRTSPVVANFVRKNQARFAGLYGEIDFDKNKTNSNYVPTFMLRKAS